VAAGLAVAPLPCLTEDTKLERRDGTLALPGEEQHDPGWCLLDSI
jgi:hypothetical protein